MRPLEVAVVVATVAILAMSAVRGWSPVRARVAAELTIVLVVVQVLVDGYRWQMYPAYLVAVWVFLAFTVPAFPTPGFWTCLAGLAGVALAAVLSSLLPVFQFPVPTGPYSVGTVTRHLVDASRAEPRSPRPGAPRELMIQIWYPAERGAGRTHYYCPRAEMPLKKEQLSLVKTHAVDEAPVDRNHGRFPVLFFSPSWEGHRYQSTFQCEELASHGYVVIGLDHLFGTAMVQLPDGRKISSKLGPWMDFTTFSAAQDSLRGTETELAVRTADVRFVLDTLERDQAVGRAGLLSDCLDLKRVGVFGHSFGGSVAAEACRLDARFRAGADFDGCWFGNAAANGVEQPFLIVTNEGPRFPPTPTMAPGMDPSMLERAFIYQDQCNIDRSLESYGGYLLHIDGVSHSSFCDSPLYAPIVPVTYTGRIEVSRAMHIINEFTLAFFDQSLNRRPTRLLTGPVATIPEARLEAWPARSSQASDRHGESIDIMTIATGKPSASVPSER